MFKRRTISMILAVTALGLTPPLAAQGRSTASTAELDAAVTAPAKGNRQTVQDFLARPDVRSVASRMGVSTASLSTAVAGLDQASLDRIARDTRASDGQLAGGASTVVISTTTIIIALLILILLVD